MRLLEIKLRKHDERLSQLPLDSIIRYLKAQIEKAPQNMGEYKSLLMRIEQSAKHTSSEIVTITASETDRIESMHLKQMTSYFISRKTGHMHCKQCKTLVPAEHIIFERYIRESTTGKRFYCKSMNHLMLELIDLKRAGENNQLAEEFSQLLKKKSLEALI